MGKKRKFSGLHKENRKTGSGKSSKLGSRSDNSETHSENSLENTEVSATLAAANSVLYSDIPTDIQSTDPYTSTPVSKRSDNITHSPVMSASWTIKNDIIDLKSRSMRDNLLFSNIPEVQGEGPIQTENILRQFLKNELKMDFIGCRSHKV